MDRYARKIENVEYALNNTLPTSYGLAYRRWLLEYWTVHGVNTRLPVEITHMIMEYLSNSYIRRIENHVLHELGY
ncbi:56ae0afd-898b-4140-ae4d-e1db30840e9e [Thermothielavioides terrestris]|uniref:Uncharacterized protein n=2 Tax=Thermothielavioides terrestris TaxID=2587410 RepID=G2RAI5_THETT|nr:uncharacterized protein THITE_2120420 [Thermothielavioides terrestris NRRL 8126]AEO69720.1 hypothetical protein THITE_2120420 [Thermothielavioides terrestris NRRL 8126]SPQ26263.1 56ae0afd-898b-4140-ae4d-e1db30840e9e [Thermothielavioides terrestris]